MGTESAPAGCLKYSVGNLPDPPQPHPRRYHQSQGHCCLRTIARVSSAPRAGDCLQGLLAFLPLSPGGGIGTPSSLMDHPGQKERQEQVGQNLREATRKELGAPGLGGDRLVSGQVKDPQTSGALTGAGAEVPPRLYTLFLHPLQPGSATEAVSPLQLDLQGAQPHGELLPSRP